MLGVSHRKTIWTVALALCLCLGLAGYRPAAAAGGMTAARDQSETSESARPDKATPTNPGWRPGRAFLPGLRTGGGQAPGRSATRSEQTGSGQIEAGEEESPGVLAGMIVTVRDLVTRIRRRIAYLRSGAPPRPLRLRADRGDTLPVSSRPRPRGALVRLLAAFALGLVGAGLFQWITTRPRRWIETVPQPSGPAVKAARLSLRAILDGTAIVIFMVFTVAAYFVLLGNTGFGRLVLIAYLGACVAVGLARLAGRAVLVPGHADLRFVPLDDDNAGYLYRWVICIAAFAAFGWLSCGLLRFQRVSAGMIVLTVALVGLVVALMLVVMIVQKRRPVAHAIRRDLPETRLGAQLADVWHLLAGVYVLLVWGFWTVGLVLFGRSVMATGLATLLSVPLFFLLDWIVQRLLGAAFTLVESSRAAHAQAGSSQADGPGVSPTGPPNGASSFDIERAHRFVRLSFRVLILAFVLFVLAGYWGIELRVARSVTQAVLNILVTVILAYVAWALISAAIGRRLSATGPLEEGDDEGGVGGDRYSTLLQLARKFILATLVTISTMIVLSSIGVDIGPLLAGAGVVGLAIGFGSQALVKDIVSGIFFLVDDAFRIGDYIETGNAKGTVEHISIRSLRLRHHRGMVHTIPFGDLSQVTNYTRDWIIMKLKFKVPHGTDIEEVRKIIKKINKTISGDDELGPKLLSKIKSQGIKEVDDVGMLMRIKFKCRPGEQFTLRREVFKLLRKHFEDRGIEFAHRRVTVHVPEEARAADPETADGAPGKAAGAGKREGQRALSSGAGAELAVGPEEPAT